MRDEMESLNIDELDVVELERRLELAPAGGPTDCTGDGGVCVGNCTSNCVGDVSWKC